MCACAAVLAGALMVAGRVTLAAAVMAGVAVLFVVPHLLKWRAMVLGVLVAIVCIPARLYKLPVTLPFDMEIYRVFILLFLVAWGIALVTDPAVRLHKTRLSLPLLAFGAVAAISFAVNLPSFEPVYEYPLAAKSLIYLVVLVLLFQAVVSVMRDSRDITWALRLIVLVAAGTALLGVAEFVTGTNVFRHLDAFLPFLRPAEPDLLLQVMVRGGNPRIAGSSNHPIAYGALLSMVLPVCIHFWLTARSLGERFVFAASAGLMGVAILLTGSRTGLVGLIVGMGLIAIQEPAWRKHLVLASIILAFAVHMAVPGLLRHTLAAITPGYIAKNELGSATTGSGRLEDYPVMFAEFVRRPLLGRAVGTYDSVRYGFIDNQYLLFLVEMGLAGIAALLWLYYRSTSWFAAAAKHAKDTERGLLFAMSASALIFAIVTATFDVFAFPQVTYLYFIFIAFGAVLASSADQADERAVGGNE